MSLATRLSRVTPALSARERAVLFVRADLDGQQPHMDPATPEAQRREYRRYLGLYYIANTELGTISHSLALQAQVLAECAETPRTLRRAAVVAAEDLGEELETSKLRAWRRKDQVTMPEYLDGLSGELADSLVRQAICRWQELRAIETVWDEIADELGEANVVRADVREEAETTKENLRALIREGRPQRRLPEPDERMLDHYRGLVEGVLRTFGILGLP